MAMVLDALASYIQNMLMEMVENKVHMLLGVPSEINNMNVKLADLKRFLTDADRRNIRDESVQGWVKELRGAMYDATDILDLCQLKAMEQGPSWDLGCFNPLLFCMRNPLHAHDIGRRLKKLNEKLDDIRKRSTTFNFNLTSYDDCGRNKESSRPTSRETTGEVDKFGVVGEIIEEDTRNLVEFLMQKEKTMHEHNKIVVFAIVGVGGIGKTTLAQNIFNNAIIQQEFEKRIWLSVNQDFNDVDLLERAITEAGGDRQAARNTKAALVRTLVEALNGYKIFLIMDDVWDHQAWERVLRSPLTNASAPGSRVLITTRHDRVARGMMAEEPYHHVDKLKPDDGWCLLKKQVVGNKNNESRVDMLKDIGMGIITKCDGLPLAIKVMGGLLRQKRTRRSEWENVLNDATWSVSEMPEALNYAIYLSYQDLHPSLKPCFLHFSLLPKSTIFCDHEVVGMWISEGFVHGSSRDLEELGTEYYNELILRNLIEPNVTYVDQTVCSMHDVVRSFAQYAARDEALVVHSSKLAVTRHLDLEKFIRLSLETKGSESNELEWLSIQAHMSLRTLISVGPIRTKPGDSLVKFSCLRTLHLQGANCDTLAKCLVQLKHLRYLSLQNTNISMLPENIDKLILLQYISLMSCRNLVKLPGSIGKLRHLRTLHIKNTCIDKVPKGFNGLTNLRKLYGFPAHMDGDRCSLEELGPLSELTELHISGLKNISSSSFARKARLFEKVRLKWLILSSSGRHEDDDMLFTIESPQQMEEVFDELCPTTSIETLDIRRYFGRRLPRWMTSKTIVHHESLRILIMEDLHCCTELPDTLCMPPYLELLQIAKAPAIKSIGPEILKPHNYENLGSVATLVVVECLGLEKIRNLQNTKEVRIIECPKLKVLVGMPKLGRLKLQDHEMEVLPAYLRDVNPRILEVDCDISLLAAMSAGKSGNEWDKFGHIKHVKAYADDYYKNSVESKWYVLYTRDPFTFKTNISLSLPFDQGN